MSIFIHANIYISDNPWDPPSPSPHAPPTSPICGGPGMGWAGVKGIPCGYIPILRTGL